MSRITMSDAIRTAIADVMRVDDTVFIMGQDIGVFGGPMQSTQGLWDEFGGDRVIDTPISEAAMIGSAIGAAMAGARPIVDLMFAEFLALAMTPLGVEAAAMRYRSNGRLPIPLVVRAKWGIGPHHGHPESLINVLVGIPGLKVVAPSRAQDAYGLMRAAIADDNPVVFLEHMSLLHGSKEEVDDTLPVRIGVADVAQPGDDVTIVGAGLMVARAKRAGRALAEDGISAEIIDLRTITPLDIETIDASASRTGAVLLLEESWPTAGVTAEIAAGLLDRHGGSLPFHLARLHPPPTPIPFALDLERMYVPSIEAIADAATAAAKARRS